MSRRAVGLGLQADKARGDYAELARIAEQGGFDVVSVFGDLLYQPPIVALLEIAAATTRVRLGAACWNPHTQHPYEIAGQLAALDAASGGRAYLGIARGSWLGAIGLPQPAPVAALRDAVAVVRTLLGGTGEAVAGHAYTLLAGTRLRYPLPARLPPVLIGTWGPQTAALAGEIADELKIGGTANPAMVPLMRRWIDVGSERVGRTAGSVGIVVGAVTVVDEDGAAARALARREVAMYLDVVAELDPTLTLPPGLLASVRLQLAVGDPAAAGDSIPDDVLDLFAFSGTPEQVAQQAEAVFEAGAQRVEFGTPHGRTATHGVRLLCDRVLPLLRLG